MNGTLTPVKSHATYQDQIHKLIADNLDITDPAKVEAYLKKVNYYRFSGYMRFFKDASSGKFTDGTTIEQLYDLYDFDRRLRKLLVGQLEIIEVMFRSRISYQLADQYGPLGHFDPANFLSTQHHCAFLSD